MSNDSESAHLFSIQTKPKPMKIPVFTSLCAFGFMVTAPAAILFTDSVESPTVTGLNSSAIPPNWLESAQGFGSGDQGLANEDTLNFTTPYGDQALEAHFAQNAGWTTAEGVIGSLVTGVTYTLTLNVAAPTSQSNNFGVALLRFDAGQTTRNDVRGSNYDSNNATLLSLNTGTATTDDMSQQIVMNYTAVAADAGKDLAIRLRSNSSSPLYFDNFLVTDDTIIPEPSVALLGGLGVLLLLRRRRENDDKF